MAKVRFYTRDFGPGVGLSSYCEVVTVVNECGVEVETKTTVEMSYIREVKEVLKAIGIEFTEEE